MKGSPVFVVLLLIVVWAVLIGAGLGRVRRALAQPRARGPFPRAAARPHRARPTRPYRADTPGAVDPAGFSWTALDDRQVARLLDEAGPQ